MRRIRLAVPVLLAALLAALAAAACGSPSTSPSATPGPQRPTDAVVGTPDPNAPSPSPSPATAKGDTIDPRKVPWTRAEPTADDDRTIRVVWSSGVEPCSTLDRVDVAERAGSVTVTLYEGPSRASPDATCIAIAIDKVTEVRLSEPLGKRKIVDGAR